MASNGDGTVEWTNYGTPSKEDISDIINSWLIEHPEATTTINDHSVTLDKIAINALGYITPEMFGAHGDGIYDDTEALHNTFSFGAKVVVLSKKYKVTINSNYEHALTIPSNTTVIFNSGQIILNNPNNRVAYSIIYIGGVNNIRITGEGFIIGDRAENTGIGEWGHGISTYNCNNIIIEGITIKDCFGDGIACEGVTSDNGYTSENIVIRNVILDHNRRNNISIINGIKILIDSCIIKNCDGTFPKYGIDIEPNNNYDQIKDIVITNCVFENNEQGSIAVYCVTDGANVMISNCMCDGTISLSLRGNNQNVLIDSCMIKPITPYAFIIDTLQSSMIEVNNSTVDCSNGLASIINYAGTAYYKVTIKNLGVFNGEIVDFATAKQESLIENIDIEYWIKGVTITGNKTAAVLNTNNFSNKEIGNCDTISLNNGNTSCDAIFNRFEISSNNTASNISLMNFANGKPIEVINKSNNDKIISDNNNSRSFINEITNVVSNNITLPASKKIIAQYDADINKYRYRIL